MNNIEELIKCAHLVMKEGPVKFENDVLACPLDETAFLVVFMEEISKLVKIIIILNNKDKKERETNESIN